MPKPPHLASVPYREPTPTERVRVRMKSAPRPTGLLQCPRCGSRSVLTVRNGVVVKDGKQVQRGTIITKGNCADCYPTLVKMIPGGQGPRPVKP